MHKRCGHDDAEREREIIQTLRFTTTHDEWIKHYKYTVMLFYMYDIL